MSPKTSAMNFCGHRLAVLVFSLLVASLAFAQDEQATNSLSASLTGRAKAEYDAGRLLYEDGDYVGARVKFHHAFDLSRDPRLLWNMAACEKNLRHYALTLRWLERYRREAGALSERDEREADALERAVRMMVSSVRVIVNQPAATLFVDDEVVGKSPLPGPILVDLGLRRFHAIKAGFKPQVVTQEVTGQSELVVAMVLERAVSRAQLTVIARRAHRIVLDGRFVGDSRWEGFVAPGLHTLSVSAQGMRPYTSDVRLRDKERRTVSIVLEPAGGGLPTAVWIAGGAVAAAALGVGGYFLFKPETKSESPVVGTMAPGTVQLP